jgi:hypothetical protein
LLCLLHCLDTCAAQTQRGEKHDLSARLDRYAADPALMSSGDGGGTDEQRAKLEMLQVKQQQHQQKIWKSEVKICECYIFNVTLSVFAFFANLSSSISCSLFSRYLSIFLLLHHVGVSTTTTMIDSPS